MREIQKRSFRERKRILAAAVLSLLALLIAVLTVTTAFAAPEDDGDEQDTESDLLPEDYNDLILELEKEHKYMKRIDQLFMPGSLVVNDDTEEGAETETADDEEKNTYTSLMQELMDGNNAPAVVTKDITTAIGIVLVIIYTIFQVMKSLQRQDQSIESLFRILLITFAGILLVIFSYEIMGLIDRLGYIFQVGVRNAVAGSKYEKVEIPLKVVPKQEAVEGEGLIKGIARWIGNIGIGLENAGNWALHLLKSVWGWAYSGAVKFFTNIGLAITFYAILGSAYGLLFEFVVRKIFMPIAIADVMAEGVRGPGVRYLKNYFGMYLRIGMFFIILYMLLFCQGWLTDQYNHHAARQVNTIMGTFGVMICVRGAAKSLMNASGGLIKEVIGG